MKYKTVRILLSIIFVITVFMRIITASAFLPQFKSFDDLAKLISSSTASVALLIFAIISLGLSIIQLKVQKIVNEKKMNQKIDELSHQISHDIRAPLSAIACLLHDTSSMPEDRRVLLKLSFERMNEIVKTLEKKRNVNNLIVELGFNSLRGPEVTSEI